MARKPKSAKTEATAPNTHEHSNPSQRAVNTEPKPHLPSNNKAAKNMKTVRRSGRLQNLVSPTQNQEMDIVADPITLIESENEDEQHVEQSDSEPTSVERNLEEKIDYLLQTVNELKSKATKRVFPGESPYTDLNYKSMYIESQKKVEALRGENHQLVKKLEFCLGKIEVVAALQLLSRITVTIKDFHSSNLKENSRKMVYEKMRDVMGNWKDTILFSSLGKATEAMINLSSHPAIGKSCCLDATTPDAPENNAADLKAAPDNAVEQRASRPKRKQR